VRARKRFSAPGSERGRGASSLSSSTLRVTKRRCATFFGAISIFFEPELLPTVAHEPEVAGSALIAAGLVTLLLVLFAPPVLCGTKALAATCMADCVRIGMGPGDVIAIGLFGRFVSRKTLGNLTLGKPRAMKPGSAGVVSMRVMRDEVVGSRLKGSRTGR
jgi:hypothetical protein